MSSRRAVPVPAFVAVVALVLSLMIVPGPAVAVATSVVCGPGTYASTDGQCTPASPGYFVATSGATAQKPCAAGTFAPTTGRTSCAPAPLGYAVPRVASSYAVQCVLGHYSYARGAQSCTARTGLEPRSVRVLRGLSSVTVAWRPPLPSRPSVTLIEYYVTVHFRLSSMSTGTVYCTAKLRFTCTATGVTAPSTASVHVVARYRQGGSMRVLARTVPRI